MLKIPFPKALEALHRAWDSREKKYTKSPSEYIAEYKRLVWYVKLCLSFVPKFLYLAKIRKTTMHTRF
jgi:hypothetical protein